MFTAIIYAVVALWIWHSSKAIKNPSIFSALLQRLAKRLGWKLTADSRVEKACQRLRSRFANLHPNLFAHRCIKQLEETQNHAN